MVVLLPSSFLPLAAFAVGALAAPLLQSTSEAALPEISPRADSFSCPVFKNWSGARETCSGDAIIWNNKTTGGKHVTYYVLPNDATIVRSGAARRKAAVEMIEGALNKGISYYERWGAGVNVYLGIVGDHSAWGSANPTTGANGQLEHCDVIIRYPGATEDAVVTLRTLKSVVHEFYHCVQYAQNLKGRNSGTSAQRDWWMEGSARFFDGIMYPITKNDKILGRGQFPEEYDPSVSLVDQSYEAALFYHYLHNVGTDPSQINEWVAGKAGRSTVAEDLADLEKTPLFVNNWHGFAEAYVDNKVNYTSTIPINIVNPLRRVETVSLSQDVGGKLTTTSRTVGGFRFIAGRYNLPARTHYVASLAQGMSAPCSMRVAGGAWRRVTTLDVSASAAGSIDIVCSCTKAAGCSSQFVFERKEY
ncbi:hypothetical protein B0T16DRAFT_415496 [Cercophora newfieldiana]|uniref:Uncharacterized protein n=1 Tax=Cercophora newfieldiana TaxID=92897 RepID=A0AA39XZJ4_9PEZI|nr:hypothetical protein B0T16DRAFT_415496 [Cercophora newfieldiana]